MYHLYICNIYHITYILSFRLTYSKVWQQIYTVCLAKTRYLQCSRSMVHNCMQWHTTSPASGSPSSSPESTTAPSVDPATSSRWQESSFSCLGKNKKQDGKKSNRVQIGWHLDTHFERRGAKTPKGPPLTRAQVPSSVRCENCILAFDLKLEGQFSLSR